MVVAGTSRSPVPPHSRVQGARSFPRWGGHRAHGEAKSPEPAFPGALHPPACK